MLKLPRATEKWAATLAEERRRLLEDQEALREREQNLRDYEARLRALQVEIEAGRTIQPAAATDPRAGTPAPFLRPSSHAPFIDDAALQSAWEKLHRAREILEAEQKNLIDDRISLQDLQKQLKKREEVVAGREARLVEREALITATTAKPAPQPTAGEQTMSAVTKITRAPFDMARSVFRGKKK